MPGTLLVPSKHLAGEQTSIPMLPAGENPTGQDPGSLFAVHKLEEQQANICGIQPCT